MTFWTIRSQSQETEKVVITTNNPQKREFFESDRSGRNEACSWGHDRLWMPKLIKTNSIC